MSLPKKCRPTSLSLHLDPFMQTRQPHFQLALSPPEQPRHRARQKPPPSPRPQRRDKASRHVADDNSNSTLAARQNVPATFRKSAVESALHFGPQPLIASPALSEERGQKKFAAASFSGGFRESDTENAPFVRNEIDFPGGKIGQPKRRFAANRQEQECSPAAVRLADFSEFSSDDSDIAEARDFPDLNNSSARDNDPARRLTGALQLDVVALERRRKSRWRRLCLHLRRSAASPTDSDTSAPSLCSRCAPRDNLSDKHATTSRPFSDRSPVTICLSPDNASSHSHPSRVLGDTHVCSGDKRQPAISATKRRRKPRRMLLPWSSAADKLGSGRATPATSSMPSPMLTRVSSRQTMGVISNGISQFNDITPGQFGLTKQLVLRITLPHISLLLVSIGYALAGCWILTAINYKADSMEAMTLVENAKSNFLAKILENRQILRDLPEDQAAELFENGYANFAEELYDVYSKFPRSTAVLQTEKVDGERVKRGPLTNVTWNLFFVATTLTSIGYGTNAPDSLVGRLFCIIYISFGVPLYLITIADLAKFCTEFMNRTYTEYLKVKHSMKMKWKRWKKREKRSRVPPSDLKDKEVRDKADRPAGLALPLTNQDVMDIDGSQFDIDRVIIAGGEEEVAEFLWTHLENTQFVEIPFVLIYIILLSYIAAASYLIAYLENWSTQKGFYFVMMSVLTIGFGDVIPSKDKHVLLVLFILLIGLIITTTCIDIVGAYYIDQLHFFGRRYDVEDPLLWLKAVQQKRIDAMKREAFRKLFETVAALNRMHFDPEIIRRQIDEKPETAIIKIAEMSEPPNPPRNLKISNPTADAVTLRWDPPVSVDEGKRYWYTLSYKTRTPQRKPNVTVIDFINTTYYEVKDLKSFTLYEFSMTTTTRFGTSKSVKCQEYTEPCTVPQSIKLNAIGPYSATISWKSARKNKGPESYILLYSQEPVGHVSTWGRFKVGRAKRFTLTDLTPDSRYVCGVSAEHNSGLATMSKTIKFKTKKLGDFSKKEGRDEPDEDSIAVHWAMEQASRSPTPTLMWRPQPFLAQITNALHSHFLSSPQLMRQLTESRPQTPQMTEDV